MRKNIIPIAIAIAIMKLSIIPILVSFTFLNAVAGKTIGQEVLSRKITLSVSNLELKKVLKEVRKKTGVRFFYSPEIIGTERRVSINAKDQELNAFLHNLLTSLGILMEVDKNGNIFLGKPAKTEGEAYEDPDESNLRATPPRNITGKVLASDGTPVEGATIQVKDNKKATATNRDGHFDIMMPENSRILIISAIGFEEKEVTVGAGNNIVVTLNTSTSNMNDLVVVGYGQTIRRKDVAGAVSSIGEKEIRDRPITRLDQAMAAQLPGVQVQSISGTPGAALQIRVRGAASVNASSDPIYVVDGIVLDDLNDLDPATVQSIDVLKDASSAAIYGARGSNGVVLITTKRGKRGQPRINFSANYALQTPEQLVPMLNPTQWIQFKKDLIDSAWVARGRTPAVNKPYKASDPMSFRATELNVPNTHLGANTTLMYDPYWEFGTDSLDYVDWQDAYYGNKALQQKYNLSASGGSDNVTYLLSGEYLNQDGMVVNSDYKRYSMRSNLEIKLNNRIKVGLNIAPSLSFSNGAEANGRGGQGAAVAGTAPIQEYGNGDHSGVAGSSAYRWVADQVSPVYYNEQVMNKTQLTKLISNVYTNINLLKGLSLNITGAWNSSSNDYKYYLPTSVSSSRRTAAPGSLSSATRTTSRNQYYTFQSVLNFDRQIRKHQISAIAGYSAEENNVSSTRQVNTGFTGDNLYTFDNLTSTVGTSSNTESKRTLVSLFGRAIYSFDGKYIVTASLRRDGTSRFGIENVYGTFPAASVAWRISQENFMSFSQDLVSDLKLRYSWGVAGNDRIGGDYPAVGLVTATNYNFNGVNYNGFSQTSISNPILKWERTTSNNWGIDASFLKSRLNISVDYYIKKTTDLLLQTPVAFTTGFATENKNIGAVQNTGLEILVGTVNIRNKNFTWSTRFNYSTSHNKVLALANNNTPIYKGWESTVEIAVGQPLYVYKVYDAIGVYQTTSSLSKSPKMSTNIIGDPMYRDVNSDGVINTLDITNVGSPIPTYYYGMTNSFTYKSFDLSLLFQGQGGNKIFSLFGRNIDRPTSGLGNYNAKAVWANRFRSVDQPGDGVTPRIDATTAGVYDTRWIYDGAFYKIKNITLGYTFKSNIIKGLNSLRAYISADNVWMHDHYDGGFSPEAFQYDNLSDWSSYPTSRTYSLGINIGL